MSKLNTLKKNYILWKKTSDFYVKWVATSELKNFFSKNIKIKNLSLWWATDICKKDNMIDNRWFFELKDFLYNNKKTKFNKPKFFLILFLKFTKNFFTSIIWYSIIKILSFTRFKKIKKSNCFHSINYNFLKNKNDYIYDRCYGNAHTVNYKKNFFLITVARRKNFFLDILGKKRIEKKIPSIVADEFISVKDVFLVNLKVLCFFFKLLNFLRFKKNLFIVNKKNCSNILLPLLLTSFSGPIQSQLYIGIAINNFLKGKKIKNFITYSEFNPGIRSIYSFIRDSNNPPKIFAIQHGHSNENLMFFKHQRNEFSKKKTDEGDLHSPSPDIYLTQGSQYAKILKKYFPRKIKIIGCLKYDIYKFKRHTSQKPSNNHKLKKKIILLCPSIGDQDYILDYLKKSINRDNTYILSPHPAYREVIEKKYFSVLKSKCDLKIINNTSTFNLLKISDVVICGFSTIAYEALFLGAKPIRVVDPYQPQFFDLKDKLPIIDNHLDLKKEFEIRNFNKKLPIARQIKREYFYKLDNKSKNRFWNIINK